MPNRIKSAAELAWGRGLEPRYPAGLHGNMREEGGGGEEGEEEKKGGERGGWRRKRKAEPPPFPPNLAPPLDGACIPRYGQLSS